MFPLALSPPAPVQEARRAHAALCWGPHTGRPSRFLCDGGAAWVDGGLSLLAPLSGSERGCRLVCPHSSSSSSSLFQFSFHGSLISDSQSTALVMDGLLVGLGRTQPSEQTRWP